MDYSKQPVMWLRRAGRRLGILRPVQRAYRRWAGAPAEAAFDRALRRSIDVGDTVWDVGAHVGVYTTVFADLVGPSGRVVAFEPSPTAFPTLAEAVHGYGHVILVDAALSDETGAATFFRSDEGPTSFHGLSATGSEHVLRPAGEVRVERGETVAAEHAPNVVKIDVEGFELQVLHGFGSALREPSLRTVAIEVHFQTLARRGFGNAPRQLVELLELSGFEVRWTDPSHLIATRRPEHVGLPDEQKALVG